MKVLFLYVYIFFKKQKISECLKKLKKIKKKKFLLRKIKLTSLKEKTSEINVIV